ncbi:S8 family serine peptidase [Pedococcus sp. 5OH_020]|uniref:S8 family serine peptidase n=1 Tax=Pedococcus sp. 5OH_020 TaxID=2989814 RepID=UPI0022E9D308|nr:S8 family serine peptidase [Pedococcus sp. 5OH_020]
MAVERDTGKVVLSVKVRGGQVAASLVDVARAAKSQGGRQRRTVRQLGTVSVEVPKAAAENLAARLRHRLDVARVDIVGRKQLTFVPNDELYPATAPYLDAVGAPSAWDVHRGDAGVRIAVVDSGVDVDHPDLAGRVSDVYNAVDGGTDVSDAIGHGTFVSGVAAASGDNAIGVAGASFGSSVMAVKVADSAGQIWSDAEAAGIVWAADHGANVVNLSLGSATPDQVESDAVAYAVGKGVLVVAAAGNDGTTTPNFPAAYPQVVAVGATDAVGQRAAFSQYGSWVSVGAPGTGITSTSPAAGSSFFQPGYDKSDGTSFSTPLVAGEAALLWSLRPGVSASDVRAAIVRSAHGYTGLGLGAGQVDFRAAMAALRPDSVPALTAPGDGAQVAGPVTLSAASSAAKVQFSIDGTSLGAPVATSGGTATALWSTWGLPNGTHTIGAVDCSDRDLCNTTATQVSVTLSNAAPVVTSPKPAQTLSGSATFNATAPGGAVAFLIDGVRRGLDATAPYALTYPVSALSDGTHTVQAVSCSTAGACGGPASAAVSFKNLSLHPKFTAVSPGVFSPNGDGRYDTSKATYYLPDTESVRYQVRNAAGTVVRGPSSLGTLAAGSHSFVWNGLLNGGSRAPSGAYKLELITTRATTAGTLRGSAVTGVRVDLAAPTMSSITGNGTSFYPYPDGYRDSFSPAFTLNESATVTMTVRTGGGSLVRTVTGTRSAARTSITWNGRNNAGSLVGGGTYYWVLTAQDAAGNRRNSAKYSVIVSSKRLVTKTATLTKNGSQFAFAGGSDTYCSDADPLASDFYPYGVWLVNVCDPYYDGSQIAGAGYRFTLPTAFSYSSLRVDSYGNSLTTSHLGAGFTRWGTDNFTFTHEISTGSSNAWRTIGSVSPTGVVSSTRQVETTIYVPNYYSDGNDYDIGKVRLVVTYKVLA